MSNLYINLPTTYQGATFSFQGASFTWDGTQYVPTFPLTTAQQDKLTTTSRTVVLNFAPIFLPSTPLRGADVQMYVDAQLWSDSIVLNGNIFTVTFDEVYLLTQRTITFASQRGVTKTSYEVKARVNADNDVVVVAVEQGTMPQQLASFSSNTLIGA